MNFHQLRVFDAVARHHSFSKAAVELSLSQPTVSVHLQKLEEELGVELVEQLGRAIHLTPAGEILFEFSRRIFDLALEAERSLEQLKGEAKGWLHLGASTTPGIYLLPKVLAQFKALRPGVELHFEVANSTAVANKVAANELDFGVVGHNIALNPSLIPTPLWDDKIVAILSPRNPLAAKDRLEPADFSLSNLVLREQGSGTRRVVEEAFAKHGVSLVPVMEFTGTEGVKQAVAADLGISLVSRASIDFELQAGALVTREIANMDINRQFFLIQHRDKHFSSLALAFLSHLQQAAVD